MVFVIRFHETTSLAMATNTAFSSSITYLQGTYAKIYKKFSYNNQFKIIFYFYYSVRYFLHADLSLGFLRIDFVGFKLIETLVRA